VPMFDTFTQNYTPPENEYVSALFAAIPRSLCSTRSLCKGRMDPRSAGEKQCVRGSGGSGCIVDHRSRGDQRQRPLGDVGREIRERTEPWDGGTKTKAAPAGCTGHREIPFLYTA